MRARTANDQVTYRASSKIGFGMRARAQLIRKIIRGPVVSPATRSQIDSTAFHSAGWTGCTDASPWRRHVLWPRNLIARTFAQAQRARERVRGGWGGR